MNARTLEIYVETSVWSFAFAEDAPDYRADTEAFLDCCRQRVFLPVISTIVLAEFERAHPALRTKLDRLVRDISPEVFAPSDRALALADAFLAAGIVPAGKPEDAQHVGAAFDRQVNVLVSWNFRHIANVRRAERFNAVAVLQGYYNQMRIVSPSEVLYAGEA